MSLTEKAKSAKDTLSGKEGHTKVYSSEKIFPEENDARNAFEEAKSRMFQVDSWGKIPGPENADFLLYDEKGFPYQETTPTGGNSRPVPGDYIKTILPGNMPEDWVRVTDVQVSPDEASFTVRPSPSPESRDREVTAHFFKSSATSTFKVERKGNRIIASETGINESINNRDPEAGERQLLNTLIAEGGWMVAQKIQWKNVTDYIVGNIEIKNAR